MYKIEFGVPCEGCETEQYESIMVFETKEVMQVLDYIEDNDFIFYNMSWDNSCLGLESFKEFTKE